MINNDLIKLIQDRLGHLVALPSVSSSNPNLDTSNAPVVEQAANWLENIGMQVEVQEVKESPRKVNLIARWNPRQEDAATGLVLSGHIDTVPAEEKPGQATPGVCAMSMASGWGWV